MDVCLSADPQSGAPKARDCPAKRNWAVAEGVACGAAVTLPKGTMPWSAACASPASPCNSVAGLPSDCSKVEVMQTDYAAADLQVGGWGGADGRAGATRWAAAGHVCCVCAAASQRLPRHGAHHLHAVASL